MLQGDCPKCRARYYGWALRSPRNQYCNECGAALDITEDGHTYHGYSPFEAEEYIIKDKKDSRIAE
jgi:hypothetical protein